MQVKHIIDRLIPRIKVVIPQAGQVLDDYACLAFDHYFVHAMDDPV